MGRLNYKIVGVYLEHNRILHHAHGYRPILGKPLLEPMIYYINLKCLHAEFQYLPQVFVFRCSCNQIDLSIVLSVWIHRYQTIEMFYNFVYICLKVITVNKLGRDCFYKMINFSLKCKGEILKKCIKHPLIRLFLDIFFYFYQI